jgi:hypothetical protein
VTGDGRVLIVAVLDPEAIRVLWYLLYCAVAVAISAGTAALLYWKRDR